MTSVRDLGRPGPAPTRHPAGLRRRLAATALALVTAATGLVVATGPASAEPVTPDFGPTIDAYAEFVDESTCQPDPKPGTLAVADLLNTGFAQKTTYFYPSNGCTSGKSGHEEGRSIDYMLDVTNAGDKAIADRIVNWMLATDKYGNKNANARRLGIMYMIWNEKIWGSERANEGWRPYSGVSTHRDHIHFSLGWDGAYKRTSWWAGAPKPPVIPATAVGNTGMSYNGSFHVMAQSSGNTLLHHFYDPGEGWSAARDAGGSVASKPSVLPYKGNMMIFARGVDNAVTYRSLTPSGWDDGWRKINGGIAGAPSASLVNNTLFVVARAGTALSYRFLDDGGWNSDGAWRALGSPSGVSIVGDPVTTVHDNRMFVFARGSDNQVWTRIFNPTASQPWTGWFVLPGQITGDPAVASRGDSLLVFGRAADGHVLYHTYTNGATSWLTNRNLYGAVVGDLAAVRTAEDNLFVYGRTSSGELVYRFLGDDGWNDHDTDVTRWRPLGKPADATLDGTPIALAYGSGQFIGSRATDASLRARAFGSNGWGNWVTIPGGSHAPIS